MGVGKSKPCPIHFEDACKRISPDILRRLEETFKRTSTASGYLPQATFFRDILGETVPAKMADTLFQGFGGSQKGIGFKDLVCGLVLLVHGTVNERAKFLANMLSEDGSYITKERLQSLVASCDIIPSPVTMETLFPQESYCTVGVFERWIKSHKDLASFSRWLLTEEVGCGSGFTLEGEPDPPTFYQTLSDKYGVTEKDVMDIEKTYWALKGSGKFDVETFQLYASPPVPKELCEGLFAAFDVNCDGHLDLGETVQAAAVCCRSGTEERHKLCFKVFDEDGDGRLSQAEFLRAVELLVRIREENTLPAEKEGERGGRGGGGGQELDPATLAGNDLREFGKAQEGSLTEQEYLQWANSNIGLSQQLPRLLVEVCHIRFGLRPRDSEEEASVVRGYMVRFEKCGRSSTGDVVYLLSAVWFNKWRERHNYQGPGATSSLGAVVHKKHKKKHKSRHHKPSRHGAPPTVGVADPSGQHLGTNHPNDSEMVEIGQDVLAPQTARLGLPPDGDTSLTSSTTADEDDRLPPIDNSVLCVPEPSGSKKLPSLTNEGGRLISNQLLVEGVDFVLLPQVVWRVFTSWYGTADYTGGPALPRLIRADGKVELYPVFFKIFRHTTLPPPAKSSSNWIYAFLNAMGFSVGSSSGSSQPAAATAAVPLIAGGEGAGQLQPPMPRRVVYYNAAFVKTTKLSEVRETIERMLHVKTDDLRLYDFSDEESPDLLEDESLAIDELELRDGTKVLVETRNKDNSWPEEMIALMMEVRAKDKEKAKPHQEVHVPPGATGLSNLGNTCFMNSALQCMSNAQPLTHYFREKEYLLEINKDNPLGMQGVMAKRYGELIQELWSGNAKSITPLKFRFTVGRCASHFNNFQQQDAQELLAFVLDGLHEDLNRVKEKPYLELQDSDGRPDEEVAREAWDYHLRRNQSVIVDLFQGQLKSLVRCKACNYESVRFDPFTFLSLPLPMESTVNLEVTVVRLDGSQPVRYGLKLEVDEKYRLLKEQLAQLCGVPFSRLLLVEVYGALVKSLPSDATKIRSVLGGWLFAYETPEGPPLEPVSRSDSPDEIYRRATLQKLKRERTLSMRKIEDEKEKAARARQRRKERAEAREREGENASSKEASAEPEPTADSVLLPTATTTTTTETSQDGDRSHDQSHDQLAEPQDHSAELHDHVDGQSPDSLDQGPESHDQTDASHEPTDLPTELPVNQISQQPEESCDNEHRSHEPAALEEPLDTDEDSNVKAGERLGSSSAACVPIPIRTVDVSEGFVFAVHRKMFSVEHYFVSNQKSRPFLFGTPLVVPCNSQSPHRELYASVWHQVQRLIIPDPPGQAQSQEEMQYPFELKIISKDGLSCALCPWFKFCRGCPLPCDDEPLGGRVAYIAVDWSLTALHLKYQTAQERPLDHESMETLKTFDSKPIDLYECFKAFVREDELGDEECWYCKQCKKHQVAVKSLEIWRLPPILIIHLKRFQFFNGRWVKSQRHVRFPVQDLEPLRYTAQNGNGDSEQQNGEVEIIDLESSPDKAQAVQVDFTEAAADEVDSGEAPASGETNEPPSGNGDLPANQATDNLSGSETASSPAHLTAGIRPSDLKTKKYDLFSLTCHSGVLGGGHYTSFAKNPNDKWYYFNDSACKETTDERVSQEESAYMLFYQLRDLDPRSCRAKQHGSKQDIGKTEDDREFEETLQKLQKNCCIQ